MKVHMVPDMKVDMVGDMKVEMVTDIKVYMVISTFMSGTMSTFMSATTVMLVMTNPLWLKWEIHQKEQWQMQNGRLLRNTVWGKQEIQA